MSAVEPEEALDELVDHILGRVNVALPGVVVSYDESTQRVNVRPAVRAHYIDEDTEERVAVRYPIIPQVPVAMMRFGGVFEVDAPLAAGDEVLLLVADRSIDEYVATGQADNTPQDLRRFDWTDAIALPVKLRPRAAAATARVVVDTSGNITVEGTSIKLGDSAVKAVALAPDVASNLAAIAATLAPMVTAFNVAPPGTPMVTLGSVLPYTPSSTASAKVTSE